MSKIKKAKKFVNEHKTLVACGATAGVTYYFARDRNVKELTKAINRMDTHSRNLISFLSEARNLDFEQEMENWNLWEFLNTNNLRDDYFAYVKRNGLSIVRGSLDEPISVS